jgi:very-short-patch-repair endonuclease
VKKHTLEDLLAERLKHHNLLDPFIRQARFRGPGGQRKWRFDFFAPTHQLAIEVEGGTFVHGRHSRGAGMRDDMEKYNAAALEGIRVLRFDAHMIQPPVHHRHPPRTKKAARQRALEGSAIATIRCALAAWNGPGLPEEPPLRKLPPRVKQ